MSTESLVQWVCTGRLVQGLCGALCKGPGPAHWGPCPFGPWPIWALAHVGPGPCGPLPIWALAHMGLGPYGPWPIWAMAQIFIFKPGCIFKPGFLLNLVLFLNLDFILKTPDKPPLAANMLFVCCSFYHSIFSLTIVGV